MTLTIAPLGEHEVDGLCALAAEIWRAHYPPLIGVAQTEYMLAQRYDPEIVRAELARGEVWWDTLAEDERIVAFASSFPVEAGGAVKIDKLYVHPERQRLGYGGALIEHTCERVIDHFFEALRPLIKRRQWRENDAAHQCDDLHVANVREVQWRFARQQDKSAALFQTNVGGA